MISFIKKWTLPVAMIVGIAGYFLLMHCSLFVDVRIFATHSLGWVTPTLIFSMLLLTFSKVAWKELCFTKLMGWLLLIQVLGAVLSYLLLISYNEIAAESAMLCFLMPTATAAAVIVSKLGGSGSIITTYTLLVNCSMAFLVPLIFSTIEPASGTSFLTTFLYVFSKIFPLLICPFLLALFIRQYCKKLHSWLEDKQPFAFYLWAISLAIVTGETVHSLVQSQEPLSLLLFIAFIGLVVCCLQFFLGKWIGSKYANRITAGQALGQKNTILGIWIALTYLHPLVAIAPGSYVLWQNIINSYQLWKKQRTS
ncbi:MAG: transporter [Bacteroidaceae bacterium]